MTVLTHTSSRTTSDRADAAVAPVAIEAARPRRMRRERDFGVGYGSSSGYASGTRYTSDWAAPRFRFS